MEVEATSLMIYYFRNNLVQLTYIKIIMVPQNLKGMLGIKDNKDLSMANNLWKMLDQMSQSSPDNYKDFVQKNIKDGFQDMKQKKQQKDKPYLIKPEVGFALKMVADLNQKIYDESQLNKKIIITKDNWSQLKSKFPVKVKMFLSVCHSKRVKDPLFRDKSTTVNNFKFSNLKDIQTLYYSLQGPHSDNGKEDYLHFCFIFNTQLFAALMSDANGKRIVMSLAVSYLQERLERDANPLLKRYNPDEYRKLCFYKVEKFSIEICQEKYNFKGDKVPTQLLLEKQVDKKRWEQEKKKLQKQEKKQKEEKKPQQIKFKKQEVQQIEEKPVALKTEEPPKKVLIEVLKEDQIKQQQEIQETIPYELNQGITGFHIQFLLNGILKISEVNLQMKSDLIKLDYKGKFIEVNLDRLVDEGSTKAKLKKKLGKLIVDVNFI